MPSFSPGVSGTPLTGAIGVASGSGFELVVSGDCTLTMPPAPVEDPTATPTPLVTYVGQPLMGATLDLTLAEKTRSSGTPGTSPSAAPSLAPVGSSSPAALGSPAASGSPAVPASPSTTTMSVSLTTTLDTVLGAQPTAEPGPNAASPTPAVGGREFAADDVLPFAVVAETSTLTISVPQQFISQATLVGGAIAPNARSGYFAADPGTGELVFVNFACLSLTTQSAEAAPPPAASATPAASANPAESATPATSETPVVESPSPPASTTP
jgi:hypothetical protein